MSRLAAHCRILNNFIEAHEFFSAASLYFKGKSPRMEMINDLRWADVFRFEKRFDEAWIVLKKVEQSILANQFLDHQDFYLQHLGKFYFDKQDYEKALESFEQALELRLKKADLDLISSTDFAIKITKQKLEV
jgi:tetratricopeptide (TPR) repeat protein